jgi:hypothetical protein
LTNAIYGFRRMLPSLRVFWWMRPLRSVSGWMLPSWSVRVQ